MVRASNEAAMHDHATLLIRCFDVHGMTASVESADGRFQPHANPVDGCVRIPLRRCGILVASFTTAPSCENAKPGASPPAWLTRFSAPSDSPLRHGYRRRQGGEARFDSFLGIKIVTAWKAGISPWLSSDFRCWTVLPRTLDGKFLSLNSALPVQGLCRV